MAKRAMKDAGNKQLTPRQAAFARNVAKGTTITEAARNAGYSKKNLAQSGHQALQAIKLKTPEVMDKLGLTVEHLIEEHLTPLLYAKETKLITHNGRLTKKVELPDNTTRRYATRMAFELHGAFPSEDPQLAAQMGIEVVVIDIPRPDRSGVGVKVTPTNARKPLELANETDAKPDPRPVQ